MNHLSRSPLPGGGIGMAPAAVAPSGGCGAPRGAGIGTPGPHGRSPTAAPSGPPTGMPFTDITRAPVADASPVQPQDSVTFSQLQLFSKCIKPSDTSSTTPQ